jgi:hypothetical protein
MLFYYTKLFIPVYSSLSVEPLLAKFVVGSGNRKWKWKMDEVRR